MLFFFIIERKEKDEEEKKNTRSQINVIDLFGERSFMNITFNIFVSFLRKGTKAKFENLLHDITYKYII